VGELRATRTKALLCLNQIITEKPLCPPMARLRANGDPGKGHVSARNRKFRREVMLLVWMPNEPC